MNVIIQYRRRPGRRPRAHHTCLPCPPPSSAPSFLANGLLPFKPSTAFPARCFVRRYTVLRIGQPIRPTQEDDLASATSAMKPGNVPAPLPVKTSLGQVSDKSDHLKTAHPALVAVVLLRRTGETEPAASSASSRSNSKEGGAQVRRFLITVVRRAEAQSSGGQPVRRSCASPG